MEKDKEELWQAEDIAGKLRVVHAYTGLELVLLDKRGDLRGATPAFREESLSILRRNQQALQQNDFVPFVGLTVVPLVQNKHLWGWLAADCPRESMEESTYCLFYWASTTWEASVLI